MGLLSFYFLPSGRIGRVRFWIGLFGLLFIAAGFNAWAFSSILGRDLLSPGAIELAKPAMQLALMVNIVFAFPLFVLLARRFHDRNKGALWALPIVLAFVGAIAALIVSTTQPQNGLLIVGAIALVWAVVLLWIVIELGFLRGTHGDNRYGRDPLAP
jgi:uncharacterized membrane protein YhaH (DUF805 family)